MPRKQVKRKPRVIPVLLLCQLLILATVTVLDVAGPDRFGPLALMLYVPAFLWGLPLLFLWPAVILRARNLLWAPLMLTLWLLFPVMGLVARSEQAPPPSGGRRIRVMSYNVKWGRHNHMAVVAEIMQWDPDLLLLQDEGDLAKSADMAPVNDLLRIRGDDEFGIGSKLGASYPTVAVLKRGAVNGYIRQWTIGSAKTAFTAVDVHLQTPRRGLAAFLHRSGNAQDQLQHNTDTRLDEVEMLTGYLSSVHGPLVVAGDFNAPMASAVCHAMTGLGLRDAFDEGGAGFGYTYGKTTPVRFPYMRIDHIFVSQDFEVLRCWAGGAAGSDHCPVIADLWLPESSR